MCFLLIGRKRPDVVDQDSKDYMSLLNAKRPKLAPSATATSKQIKNEPFPLGTEESKGNFGTASSDNIPLEQELMQEFEEETETIFKQSETCYTHYKAMLRSEK